MKEEQLTFWPEAHPVSRSLLPDLEEGLTTTEETLPSHIAEWLTNYVLDGQSGKMSQVSYPQTEDETLAPLSGRWLNSGIAVAGECWTLKTSESHKDAEECFLLDVLQEIGAIQPRYYLSPVAAQGILNRAEKRNKKMPDALKDALLTTSKGLGNTEKEK
tara:strand:- start:37 stop:516 length:480 start_codon:yes stop_codon:yes gene_type:complete